MNAPQHNPGRFSSAEFQRVARRGGFGDMRVELRRGMIVKMSPQYVPHAHIKRELARGLTLALEKAKLAWEIYSEVSVEFAEDFEPLPDIVVFDPSLLPANLEGPLPAAAVKLIVEIADSSLADDLGEKLQDYAAGGLAEYWVADVKGRIILRHVGPQAQDYAKREPARFGEACTSLMHAALTVDTSALV